MQKQSPSSGNGREVRVSLSPGERGRLLAWSRRRTLAARVVVRSRIVLMLAEGAGVNAVADRLGVAPATVRLWRKRFGDLGPEGLLVEAPGRGRKPLLPAAVRDAIRNGPNGDGAMSVRAQARALGVSASTVSRWRRRGG